MKARSLIAAMLLMVLLAGACAGGTDGSDTDPPQDDDVASASPTPEEGPTAAEFVAQVDEICVTTARSFVENEARYKANTTRKQSIEIEAEGVVLVRARLEQLQQVEPPEELQSDYDKWLDLRTQAVETYEKVNAAFNKNDKKAQTRANAKLTKQLEKINTTGEALGFFACANRLPAAEVKKVKKTLVTYFTKLASCSRLTTKALIKVIGLGKCASELIASKKVKVSDVEGAEGVRAGAIVVPDAYGKAKLSVQLLFEDGVYKVHGYGEAQ